MQINTTNPPGNETLVVEYLHELGGVGTALGLSALHVATAIALAGLALVALATLGAWWRFGRQTVSLATLVTMPAYLAWKLPLYLGLVLRGRQRTWVRTERAPEAGPVAGGSDGGAAP